MKRVIDAFLKAFATAGLILAVVVLCFFGVEGFARDMLGFDQARLLLWFDVLCNAIMMAVVLAAVFFVYFLVGGKEGPPKKNIGESLH